MAADPDTMIATIEATLARLYAKDTDSMSMEQRTVHYRNVSELENSLDKWERRKAISADSSTGGLRQCKPNFKGMN